MHQATCTVCGDKATKLRYSHYGAVSCFSCRAFFRRTVEKGTPKYTCQNESKRFKNNAATLPKCEINKNTRRKCAACRFDKCILMGMKHTPAYNESTTKCNKVEEISAYDIPSREPFTTISFDELEKISELTEIERATRLPLTEALLMKNPSDESRFSWNFIKTFILAAISGKTLEYAAIFWGYTMGIRKLTRFSLFIPEFNELDVNEQKVLLLHNLDPMFNIKSGFFFLTDGVAGLAEQLDRFSIFDIPSIQSCAEWIPFSQLIAIDKIPKVPCVKWNQFFTTPWADNVEHERKYEYLVARLKDLRLDFNSACLLSIVALFNTDDIDASKLKPETLLKVRKYRLQFCRLLYRYLCHNRGQEEAKTSYPLHLRMLVNLREMSDIIKNKSIKILPVPSVEEQMKTTMNHVLNQD